MTSHVYEKDALLFYIVLLTVKINMEINITKVKDITLKFK